MNTGSAPVLKRRLVGDIRGTFRVRDYQRGYRWGQDDVRRLLDDIEDAATRDYYLQPVVVKSLGDDRWELVDGQQRLTTLYLTLRCIGKRLRLPRGPLYTLSYDTRPDSTAYLDSLDTLDEPVSRRYIDYFYMYRAFKCIEDWFRKHESESAAAEVVFRALSESVYVIWYQVPDTPEFDSRTLFTRLNVGRIPLTDAELVKALLLSRIARPDETASQWDLIERDLRRPEVWAFVTGKADDEPTRIRLLLESLADKDDGPPPGGDRPDYHTFEQLRPRIERSPESAEHLWDEIVSLHSLILGWYENHDLFHQVGYLVAAERSSFLELVSLAERITKKDFCRELNTLIADSLRLSSTGVESLTYQNPKPAGRALLLMNVETLRLGDRSMRFSFAAHASQGWSLEHIHAQHSEGLSTRDQWRDWLADHQSVLDALDHRPRAEIEEWKTKLVEARELPNLSRETFDALQRELVVLFTETGDASDPDDPYHDLDGIANLALLDSGSNSVLSNSFFEVKRRKVIKLDRSGAYIPVCTRNVFLKYYTDGPTRQLYRWGRRDREGYLREMLRKLAPYLLEDVPENYFSEDPDQGVESEA